MASSNNECEYDPDHLYHDHREADELRAEVKRLRAVVVAAQELIADSHGYGCLAALMDGTDDECTCGYRVFRDALAAIAIRPNCAG